MSKWLHNNKLLLEPPQGVYGFIYRITWEGGYYIGAKSFWANRTVRLSKKKSEELYSGKGRRPTKAKTIKESDWKTYKSSSKEVQSLVADLGEQAFTWEILHFAKSKSDLAYQETQYILCNNCLKDPLCMNMWVTARIHKKNLK